MSSFFGFYVHLFPLSQWTFTFNFHCPWSLSLLLQEIHLDPLSGSAVLVMQYWLLWKIAVTAVYRLHCPVILEIFYARVQIFSCIKEKKKSTINKLYVHFYLKLTCDLSAVFKIYFVMSFKDILFSFWFLVLPTMQLDYLLIVVLVGFSSCVISTRRRQFLFRVELFLKCLMRTCTIFWEFICLLVVSLSKMVSS